MLRMNPNCSANNGRCRKRAKRGRSRCEEHLAAARARWRRRVAERQRGGFCADCPADDLRPATYGQRCERHHRKNVRRSKQWSSEHPEYRRTRYAQVKVYVKCGLCPYCTQHRKLVAGRARCAPCAKRCRLLESGKILPWSKTRFEFTRGRNYKE
jgi:hypothetical protein